MVSLTPAVCALVGRAGEVVGWRGVSAHSAGQKPEPRNSFLSASQRVHLKNHNLTKGKNMPRINTLRRHYSGTVWTRQTWSADDVDYGLYLHTWSVPRNSGIGLWVVEYRDRQRKYFVVDGNQGDCGEEPVVAGPFVREGDAMMCALMLTATGAVESGTCHP